MRKVWLLKASPERTDAEMTCLVELKCDQRYLTVPGFICPKTGDVALAIDKYRILARGNGEGDGNE